MMEMRTLSWVMLICSLSVGLFYCGCGREPSVDTVAIASSTSDEEARIQAERAGVDSERRALEDERAAFQREKEGWRVVESGWTTGSITRIVVSQSEPGSTEEPVVKMTFTSYHHDEVVATVVVQAPLSDIRSYASGRGLSDVLDLLGKTVTISSSLGEGEDPKLAGEEPPERVVILKTKVVERSQ